MKWIHLLPLFILTPYTTAKEIDSNDITIPSPPVNLNSSLRKALLRALTELENEEIEKSEEGTSKTVYFSTTARSSDTDKIVERASASVVSVYANENDNENDDSTTQELTTVTQSTLKPLVVIQKSDGFQHRPFISLENNHQTPNAEQLIRSASNSFTSNKNFGGESRSSNFNSIGANERRVTPGVKSVSITPKPIITTPVPISSTAENEAKVEDVQFFSAPLVAAFTVHQDERGLPKKVEPIYKIAGQTSVSSKQLEDRERLRHEQLKLEQLKQEQIKQDQLNHHNSLQQKTKLLEEQIFNLQQQQKNQQDYLLRQQQILLEQQAHNQRLLLEQQRQKINEKPFVPISNPNQNQIATNTQITSQSQNLVNANNQFKQNFNNQNQFTAPNQFSPPKFQENRFKSNTFVSLQPSLAINPTQISNLPLNAQILPIRNAVDFNRPPSIQQQHQISSIAQQPIVQQSISHQPILQPQPPVAPIQQPPIETSLVPPLQQLSAFGNFQNFQNNLVQSLPSVEQSIRVFRQETGVGNLGFNNQFGQFQEPQSNRFFRSNLDNFQGNRNFFQQPQPQNHQQLNNLLFHSGITRNVRQGEDLNLVSKILSYNVGRDNFFSGSRASEQRLPSPIH